MERKPQGLECVRDFVAGAIESVRFALIPKQKYIIETSPEFDALWSELARKKGTTKEGILVRAVASYSVLHKETHPVVQMKGEVRKVSITDMQDNVIRDVELP